VGTARETGDDCHQKRLLEHLMLKKPKPRERKSIATNAESSGTKKKGASLLFRERPRRLDDYIGVAKNKQ